MIEQYNQRVGKFTVGRDLIVETPETLAEMFKQMDFVALRVEHFPSSDSYQYVGYSSLFKPIEMGQAMPEYLIEVTDMTDSKGKKLAINVKGL